MASGWDLWVWLLCIGVVSVCCCIKEVRYASKNCSKNGPFRLRCTATAFS